VSIIPSTLVNQEYTVTDPSEPYSFSAFALTPSYCDIAYSYSVVELIESGTTTNIDQLISFNSDVESLGFSFFYDSDTITAGLIYKEYEVTVSAVSGDVVPVSAETSFILKVINPCQDNARISIIPPELPEDLPKYKINIGREGTVA
jgi:hypothetical protein